MRSKKTFRMLLSQDWLPAPGRKQEPAADEHGRPAGAARKEGKGPGGTGPRTGRPRFPMGYFLFLGFALLFFNLLAPRSTVGLVDYSEFKGKIRQGEIQRVEMHPDMILGFTTRTPDTTRGRAAAADTGKVFRAMPVQDPELVKLLDSAKVSYTARVDAGAGFKSFFFNWVLPALFFIGLWMLLMPRLGGGGGAGAGLFALGKSKAHVVAEGEVGVTFDDVAGVDEAKDELKEIIDFLRTPAKYLAIGGKIPKGVLLVGPPGTGKTLLAKAVAGEAKVPFFRISGSDFVEMIVGVGAARVRDLFKQAREKAPCIVFIDELDAIGKSRTNMMGGHDEREQTLNQLLVEMDGFDPRAGVIILAATNRPEILDPALLRPGRFDRQVVVDKPDLKGRRAILERHARGVRLAPGVDFEALARRTPGFAGADLANIVNEGALLAVKADRTEVTQADLEEAVEKVMAGLKKKNRVMTAKDKERVAHHETGHALVAAFTPGADPVDKVSIIPRGLGALGYTLQLPTEERYLMTEGELLSRIDVLLGGRAAEEIMYGEVSTGAANDLARATEIARQMVMDHGMNERYRNTVLRSSRQNPFGMAYPDSVGAREVAESTQQYADEQVARILRERYERVLDLLRARKGQLVRVAGRLLEKESLSEKEFRDAVREGEAEAASAATAAAARAPGGAADPQAASPAAPQPASQPAPAAPPETVDAGPARGA